MSCFYHFCPCQDIPPSLIEEFNPRGSNKRELDELRRKYIQNNFAVLEMWECEWWRLYHTIIIATKDIREKLLKRRSLATKQLLEEIKDRKLFGYIRCDSEVPKNLRTNFAKLPPIFKNTLVSKNDISDCKKMYAQQEGIISQPRTNLISSFTLHNGTLCYPFIMNWVVFVGKLTASLVHAKNFFNSFAQSAVDARRQGDESPNSSVVVETKQLVANSSYGYQVMDQSQHTVTKQLNDEKTHVAINGKLFKKIFYMNNPNI